MKDRQLEEMRFQNVTDMTYRVSSYLFTYLPLNYK